MTTNDEAMLLISPKVTIDQMAPEETDAIPREMFAEMTPLRRTEGTVSAGVNIAKTLLTGESAAKKLPTVPILLLGTKQIPNPPVTARTRIMLETIALTEPFERIDQSKPSVVQNAR